MMLYFFLLGLLIGSSVFSSGVPALPSQSEPSSQSITSNLALPIGLSSHVDLSLSSGFPPTPTNLSVSPLATQNVRCNGTEYRSNLRADSCMNVLTQVPRDPRPVRFSRRGGGNYDVGLPARWISRECLYCISPPGPCVAYIGLRL